MFCVGSSQRIAKFILLSIQCIDYVISLTSEEAHEKEDFWIKGSNGKENNLPHTFLSTTTESEIQKNLRNHIVPTTAPVFPFKGRSPFRDFLGYGLLTLLLIVLLIFFVSLCIKKATGKNCLAPETDSHLPTSSNAQQPTSQRPDFSENSHLPPERTDFLVDLPRQPLERNPVSDTRREQFVEPMGSELHHNRHAVDAIDLPISFINPIHANASQEETQTNNTFGGKPPDYTTVLLGDLANPTQPIFPVVKKDDETPPPRYSKENTFFK